MRSKKLLCFIFIVALSACGTNESTNKETDVDLTLLSSTMLYSEVYNMISNPADYLGKTVKITGNFSVYEDSAFGNNYFSVLVTDEINCCQQGFEFVLKDDYIYPDDYPELDSQITIIGVFNTYLENGYEYCQLLDATLLQ